MPTEQEWPGVMIREASTVHPVLGRGGKRKRKKKEEEGKRTTYLIRN